MNLECCPQICYGTRACQDIRAWAGSQLLADWDVSERPTVPVEPRATSRVTFEAPARGRRAEGIAHQFSALDSVSDVSGYRRWCTLCSVFFFGGAL